MVLLEQGSFPWRFPWRFDCLYLSFSICPQDRKGSRSLFLLGWKGSRHYSLHTLVIPIVINWEGFSTFHFFPSFSAPPPSFS